MKKPDSNQYSNQYPNAGALRRSAALVYDLFLIVAIWMLTTTVIVSLFNQGEAVSGRPFQGLLLLEVFVFYGFFWRIKGQTLGMQVWKIRAVNAAGNIMTWPEISWRFFLATLTWVPFGIGFLWMIIDRDRLTFYDRFSDTRVVYLGSKPYEAERE